MEVFATAELPKLLDRQEVLTLADSRYLLVEFYFDERGDYMDDALRLVADRAVWEWRQSRRPGGFWSGDLPMW